MDARELIFAELNQGSDCRSYLIGSRSVREALVVDPLLEQVPYYLARLRAEGLQLSLAIDTHTHADHLSGSRELALALGGRTAGAPRGSVELPLGEGDELSLGQLRISVWSSPGHTADSLCLLLPDRVLSADTLLIGTTGRTDLPTGDAEAAWTSLERLLTLPGETLVFPGHDYAGRTCSTIAEECEKNARHKLGRERFIAQMREPRQSKPALLEQALAYNTRPR